MKCRNSWTVKWI